MRENILKKTPHHSRNFLFLILTILLLSGSFPQILQAQICGDAVVDPGEACDGGLGPQTRVFEGALIGSPSDLILGNDGQIYFADFFTDSINRIDVATGTIEEFIPTTDGVNYNFTAPRNLIQASNGIFYVSEAISDTIYAFDENGVFLESVTSINDPNGLIINPNPIDGRLLVASPTDGVIYSLPLNNLAAAPVVFADDAESNPIDMVAISTEELLVLNRQSHNISAFQDLDQAMATSTGVWLHPIGIANLDTPLHIGLTSDSSRVLVSDFALNRLVVFDFEGAFWGTSASNASWSGVDGFASDLAGNLYVANRTISQIYKVIYSQGNADEPNMCRTNCTLPVCGDGLVDDGAEFGEQCDDGNLTDGDGCSASCQNESDIPSPNSDSILEGGCALNFSGQSGAFGTILAGLALIMGFTSWRFRRRS